MLLIGDKGPFPTDPVLGATVGAARPGARPFWERGRKIQAPLADGRGPVPPSMAGASTRALRMPGPAHAAGTGLSPVMS